MEYFRTNKVTGKMSTANFDLLPLIQKFSFYDFCNEADTVDHGAFLVITNMQYILGYNYGYGDGPHEDAFARTMKDILGGGVIRSEDEVLKLAKMAKTKYITARIMYEVYEDDYSHIKRKSGRIAFLLGYHPKITKEQYEMFKEFYDDYNEEIKCVCQKFPFIVTFSYYNEENKIKRFESDSLDMVKEYLEKNIVLEENIDEECILLKGNTNIK